MTVLFMNPECIQTIREALEADEDYWKNIASECTNDERNGHVQRIAEARLALDKSVETYPNYDNSRDSIVDLISREPCPSPTQDVSAFIKSYSMLQGLRADGSWALIARCAVCNELTEENSEGHEHPGEPGSVYDASGNVRLGG